MTLPRDLKTTVNKMAHRAGLAYEADFRRRILAELERLRLAGAKPEQLRDFVDAQRLTTPF